METSFARGSPADFIMLTIIELEQIERARQESWQRALQKIYWREPNLLEQQLLDARDWQCIACGADLCVVSWHIDHIIPKSRGGSNDVHNLQVLCATCNLVKGALTMKEWRPWLYVNGNLINVWPQLGRQTDSIIIERPAHVRPVVEWIPRIARPVVPRSQRNRKRARRGWAHRSQM
jgi:hypothetical protein